MKTRIRAIAIGAAIATLLLVAAAGSGSGSKEAATGKGPEAAKRYDISLTEFAIVPGEIDVPRASH
jgi:hypothetical protein